MTYTTEFMVKLVQKSESSKANFTLVDKVEYDEIKPADPIEEQHCESGKV